MQIRWLRDQLFGKPPFMIQLSLSKFLTGSVIQK
jgi:hypothetical protein